jgi:lipopolysaccharide/colanic/teichoic acid biosynthesis glycosyltransferase
MAQKTLIGGEDAMAVALDWIGITVALLLLSLLACFLLCVSVCSRADDGGSVCFRL